MSKFHTEGLIKEVRIDGEKVTFTLEPVTPYIFENKKDDGSIERCLLFVDENISKENEDEAYYHAAYVMQSSTAVK